MSEIGRDAKLDRSQQKNQRRVQSVRANGEPEARLLDPGTKTRLLTLSVVCHFHVGKHGKKAADQQIPRYVDKKSRSHRL